jgi:hypothetical protein
LVYTLVLIASLSLALSRAFVPGPVGPLWLAAWFLIGTSLGAIVGISNINGGFSPEEVSEAIESGVVIGYLLFTPLLFVSYIVDLFFIALVRRNLAWCKNCSKLWPMVLLLGANICAAFMLVWMPVNLPLALKKRPVVSRVFRTFDLRWELGKLLGWVDLPWPMGQGERSGDGDDFGQAIHLQVPFGSPASSGDVSEPGRD